MKVLVTGGRDYLDAPRVNQVLDAIHLQSPISLLIEGGATGADEWAFLWSKRQEVPCLRHPAKWRTGTHMAGEGPIRNKAMLQWQPDLVVAFPGGSGTAGMIKLAKDAGIEVRQIADVAR